MMPTRCKTKACKACRPQLKAKLAMLVEYGILTHGRSLLITITLRAVTDAMRDAKYVAKAWARLLLWLKDAHPQSRWVKIVELTKKNQPHLHLIVFLGTCSLPRTVAACQKRAKYDKRWLGMECSCDEHTWSRAWHSITGDSYVVDVEEIHSASRAGSYIAKYVAKGIATTEGLRALGFTRHWSRSRNWPVDKLQLAITGGEGWKYVEFQKHGEASARPRMGSAEGQIRRIGGQYHRLLTREGTDLAVALAERNERNRKAAEIKEWMVMIDY